MVPEYNGKGCLEANLEPYLDSVRRGVQTLQDRAAPVVIGPVTLAYLTKTSDRRALLQELLPIYQDLLGKVAEMDVSEIQIHEAALVYEDDALLELFQMTYPTILSKVPKSSAINMVSFLEDVGEKHYKWLISVKEVDIISLDFTRGDNLALIQAHGFPSDKVLGAGLIDSRSVWSIQPKTTKPLLEMLKSLVPSIRIQPSAPLQYVPWDLACEKDILNHPAAPVLSFATQKLDQLKLVAKALTDPSSLDPLDKAWDDYLAVVASQGSVTKRLENMTKDDFVRKEPYEVRRPKQLQKLPLLPTTTIGSFPQTKEIRQLRAQRKKGLLNEADYNAAIDNQIALAIGIQEGLGLDILVHGEAERTDMVEFFAQQLDGMLFTSNGWVQSFGSRCVRPPIIWSNVSRPKPMTVREFSVAQALTDKPVKGMLTGPITILNWSFPRSDITREEQAMQIALCIRDEIADLEEVGCMVVQVDEPALREAMPLRADKKQAYLDWAVDAFRLATARALSETQIHTHMCYCEFHDCMDAIDKMDTDVNSIENARSDNATLMAFKKIGYRKGFGPGTYDIHSPVVPPVHFIEGKIRSFLECLDAQRLVVNPDCGLKTRTWPETLAALRNMVEATHKVRTELVAASN